jgi:hypothetical protein
MEESTPSGETETIFNSFCWAIPKECNSSKEPMTRIIPWRIPVHPFYVGVLEEIFQKW